MQLPVETPKRDDLLALLSEDQDLAAKEEDRLVCLLTSTILRKRDAVLPTLAVDEDTCATLRGSPFLSQNLLANLDPVLVTKIKEDRIRMRG